MFICSKKDCGKRAEKVVKLNLFCKGFDLPAEVYTTIFACSEDHQTDDGDIRYFLEHNWELLSVGFVQRHFPEPELERTLLAWFPIEDYEEFLRQYAGVDGSAKKMVTIN